MNEAAKMRPRIDPDISIWRFPVSEPIMAGDACRVQHDGTMRRLRDGESARFMTDYLAVRDSVPDTPAPFVRIGDRGRELFRTL